MKPFRYVLHINKDEKQPKEQRRWAAVGPLFFLKKAADGISSAAKDDFRRNRFCRTIANLTREDCDVIAQGNHTEAQETIDRLESSYHLYDILVSTFIPLVLVLVLAGWSDRYLRRRVLLLVPLLGGATDWFLHLLLAAFPKWPVEILYLAPLLTSITGGTAVFEMASYALMADTSDASTRTHAMGRLTNLRVLGTALGALSGIHMLKDSSVSSAWIFSTSLGLEALCLLYTVLVLREEGGGVGHEEGGRAGASTQRRDGKGKILEVLHPKNVKEVFEVLRRPREDGGRSRLLGFLLLWSLAVFSRPPGLERWSSQVLGWDFHLYSIWSKSALLIGQVMTIIVLVTMRWRPVDDCLLATISEATSGPENLVLLAISGPDLAWMLWLVLLFSLMHNFTEIGVTSAASKTVRSTEHARLFGLLAALRVVTFQLQRVSYASLTSGAKDTFPSAQFLVAAVCACFNASLAASLYRRRPRRRVEGEGGGEGEGEGGGDSRGEGDRQCEKIGGVDVAIYF